MLVLLSSTNYNNFINGRREEFFKPSIKADLNDAIDPVKVTHDTSSS